MSRLIHRRIKVVPLVHPTVARTTATDEQNAAIDSKGFEEAFVIVHSGVIDAAVNLNIAIQHSDEPAANFAVVPVPVDTKINPRLFKFIDTDDNTMKVAYLDLSGLKRYIKPVDTLTANSAFYTMFVILVGPEDSSLTEESGQPYQADATP